MDEWFGEIKCQGINSGSWKTCLQNLNEFGWRIVEIWMLKENAWNGQNGAWMVMDEWFWKMKCQGINSGSWRTCLWNLNEFGWRIVEIWMLKENAWNWQNGFDHRCFWHSWLSIFIGVHVAHTWFFWILDFGASVYNGYYINVIFSKLSMTTVLTLMVFHTYRRPRGAHVFFLESSILEQACIMDTT